MIQIPPDRSHNRAAKSERGNARPLPHPLTPYEDLVVNFCPTGMIPTKSMTPHVPVSPSEVIDQACAALERGVAIVHLHARDDDGSPTYRGEIYEQMILGIRAEFPEAITCVSCSGRNFPEFERRSEVLELTGAARPDLASLTLTTLDFPTGTSQNAPEMVIALAEKMIAKGIKPELECFDYGMINAANMLISKGILGEGPYYFNLLLGSRYSVPATAKHLAGMIGDLPRGLHLVRGGHRALPAPDEHDGHRHGRPHPRGTRGQHLPRLRPQRARIQPRAGRARGRLERDLRPAGWRLRHAPAPCSVSARPPRSSSALP